MARPKSLLPLKTSQINIHVTPEVAADFKRRMRESGLNASEYLREVGIENRSVIVQFIRPPQRELWLLSNIANNVNQAARVLNEAARSGTVSDALAEKVLAGLRGKLGVAQGDAAEVFHGDD